MTDYVEKVFEILGLIPDQKFALKNTSLLDIYTDSNIKIKSGDSTEPIYFFDDKLNLCCEKDNKAYISSWFNLRNILNEEVRIVKDMSLSNNDKIAIEYTKAMGYKYIAMDDNGDVYAFESKPYKTLFGEWRDMSDEPVDKVKINIPVSFISSEDDLPYKVN